MRSNYLIVVVQLCYLSISRLDITLQHIKTHKRHISHERMDELWMHYKAEGVAKGRLRMIPISLITNGPRQSNFELLRIVAMFLVLVVHSDFWALGAPSVNDLCDNPTNVITRVLFQSMSIVCVNVFILISGWFGIKPSLTGISKFLFQCAFFYFGIYILLWVLGQVSFSFNGIMACLGLAKSNWFILSYLGLYLVTPVLNTFLENTSIKKLEIFLVYFYIFQTIYGWSGAAKYFEFGYSTFSFIGLYMLARYIHRNLYKGLLTRWG